MTQQEQDKGKLPGLSVEDAKQVASAVPARDYVVLASDVLEEYGFERHIPWVKQSDATLKALRTNRAAIATREP